MPLRYIYFGLVHGWFQDFNMIQAFLPVSCTLIISDFVITHAHMHAHTCIHICPHACMQAHTHTTRMHAHMYACMHTCMHTHMHARTHAHTHACTHTHTHTHTHTQDSGNCIHILSFRQWKNTLSMTLRRNCSSAEKIWLSWHCWVAVTMGTGWRASDRRKCWTWSTASRNILMMFSQGNHETICYSKTFRVELQLCMGCGIYTQSRAWGVAQLVFFSLLLGCP